MTAPKIGERHRECAESIMKTASRPSVLPFNQFSLEEIIAKHFPEDDENVARIDVVLAAERISQLLPEVFETIGAYRKVLEIINGCRRG